MNGAKRKIRDDEAAAELRRIQGERGGSLLPADVVEAASAPESPLHRFFDWEDSEAAFKWRLHQARNLINAIVIVETRSGREIFAFVSLVDDRQAGEGYRETLVVLADPDLRARALEQALREARSWAQRYADLQELSEVFAALAEVGKTARKRAPRKRGGAKAQEKSASPPA